MHVQNKKYRNFIFISHLTAQFIKKRDTRMSIFIDKVLSFAAGNCVSNSDINPYNAEIFLSETMRPKGHHKCLS